jgi:gag-polypeptide of LTR copia-type
MSCLKSYNLFVVFVFVPAFPPLGSFGKVSSCVFARRSDVSSLISQDLIDNVVGTDATADPDAYADWYNKDQEALLQIVMTLKDGPHNSILDTKSSKECWDILAKCYCVKGNQGMVHLMEKFFNTSLTDSEPIQGQIDQLKLTVQSLEAAGFTLEDKWIAGLIITKLPESYSMLKTIFASINDSD